MIDELARELLELLAGRPAPHLVGVAGGVASGKSTVSAALAERFAAGGRRTAVVATDSFLLPNAVLAERGLTYRKGFPESYDHDALAACLAAIKEGRPAAVPVYSHLTYDRVAGDATVIEGADVVIVEGVNALQPPAVEALDASVYVHAEEADLRAWFAARFLTLCEEGRGRPGSFYAPFAGLAPAEVLAVADAAWDGINGPNLREHILPSRSRATFVLEKAADHGATALRRQ